jgi:hypothetical protein
VIEFQPLFNALASGPRENGTAELELALQFIESTLKSFGLNVETFQYQGHPFRLRITGFAALLGGFLYSWMLLKSKKRVALLVLLATASMLVLELDYGISILNRFYSVPQHHVVALIPSVEKVTQRIIFSSHVDTKTDALDHVQRAPIDIATPILLLLMLAGCFVQRLKRWSLWAGALCGMLLFITLSAGAFVSKRSHGAIDSGAGCMVLLRMAEEIHNRPLSHTEVQFVFFSGEEVGIEGSELWLEGNTLPSQTKVINLDGVGASEHLAVFKAERYSVSGYLPDENLISIVSESHTQRTGIPLHRTWYPASTDGRAFLRKGIPALTLTSDLSEHQIQRGMHSSEDSGERILLPALESTVAVLLNAASRIDSADP